MKRRWRQKQEAGERQKKEKPRESVIKQLLERNRTSSRKSLRKIKATTSKM